MLRRFAPIVYVAAVRGYSTPTAGSHQVNNQHAPHSGHLTNIDLNKLSMWEESKKKPPVWKNPTGHEVWDLQDVEKIRITHKPTNGISDTLAYVTVQTMRTVFDFVSGFTFGKITEKKYITRIIFLETVAGVPGMVAGMLRHLHSLRALKRDHGWIHTLLEEAENERMHLLTFMEMRQTGILLRTLIVLLQGIFFNFFFVAYLASPRFCHRLVGYIEEEAVKTYTHIINDIDAGKLDGFKTMACPPIAISYWKLRPTASFRDLCVAVRADEASHRLVNHTFADMHEHKMADGTNPFLHVDRALGSTKAKDS